MPDFMNMPAPVKIGLAVAGGGGLLYVVSALFPGAAAWILLLGGVCVALVLSAYALLLKWMEKRKARPLERGILGQGAVAPMELSAPASRARLDDLHKNFAAGFTKLKNARKDWHTLPWYVIVGESGSGKTEAVRHCSVGFPPGLQDEFQGVGGTINMNWWFTNRAIILDTAGRIMFEEVEPGSASEWLEFLRLLRRARPNCPINGMFLVIPADSLIKDTSDVIERKAGKIIRQLDVIQRELDIRFPVYVVVTKCDLVNGFREFFDNIHDVQLQHQILGWSNPAPLDEPIPLASLEQELGALVGRLNRRRMGLMLDPVPADDPNLRRADQVDALYAFPQSLMHLLPRLKRYLEVAFGSSEWSTKPLFLRGIYFTSAMREGAALDADLAEALGVPVESLPEGRVWERDRAYFLRDVLVSKAFPEQGLVTRARNAGRQHRWRKIAVLASGFASVIVLALMTWLGARTLRQSIGEHHDYWQAAAQARWDPASGVCEPIVAAEYEGGPCNQYTGASPLTRQRSSAGGPGGGSGDREPVTIAGKAVTLGQFYSDLYNLSRKKIEVPWVFSLARLGDDLDAKRTAAFALLYERGVLRPLFQETRSRLLSQKRPATTPSQPATASAPASEQESRDWAPKGAATAALTALVRAEAAGHSRRPASREDSLGPLARYVLVPEGYDLYRQQHQDALDWILCQLYPGGRDWPPAAVLDLCTPQAHQAIRAGIESFVRCNSSEALPPSEIMGRIQHLRQVLLAFAQAEDRLLGLPADFETKWSKPTAQTVAEFQWTAAEYGQRLTAVEAAARALVEARKTFDQAQRLSMVPLCREQASLHSRSVGQAYQALLEATGVKPPASTTQPIGGPPDCVLGEAYERLAKARDEQIARIERSAAQLAADLERLENEHLEVMGGDGLAGYAYRCRMYAQASQSVGQGVQAATLPAPPPPEGFVQAVLDLRRSLQQFDDSARGAETMPATGPQPLTTSRLGRAERTCRFVAVQVAACRKYRLLRDLLDAAPASSQAWEQAVTKQTQLANLVAIPRPEIPLTAAAKEEPFDRSYHPAAFTAVLAAWKSLEDAVQPAPRGEPAEPSASRGVWPLGRAELADRHRTRQAVLDTYLAAYVDFWCRQVGTKASAGLLKVTAADWKSLNAGLRSTSVEQINIGLEKLGNAVVSALAAGKGMVGQEAATRAAETTAMIQSSLGSLKLDTFQVASDKTVRNWQGLPEDAERARKTLLPARPSDYVGPALLDNGYVGRYWKELSLTALELLSASFQDAVLQAIKALKENGAKFPLVAPARLQGEALDSLTAAQLDEARRLLSIIVSEAQARSRDEAGLSIAQGAETRDAEINYQLRRLRQAPLLEADQDWVRKVKRVADALPAGAERAKCTITIPRQKDDTFTNWLLHVYLKQGDTVVGKERTAQQDGKLGEVEYPGEPLRVEFYRHPDDKEPARTIAVGGRWAILHLLHPTQLEEKLPGGAFAKRGVCSWESRERSSDGKTWKVSLTVRDDAGKDRSFWIQVEFEKPVPEISQWPSGPPK